MPRVLWFSLAVMAICCVQVSAADQPIDALQYAKGAATWILAVSRTQDGKLTWPTNDSEKKNPAFDLYYGMPGGILLLAELAKEDPAGPFANALPASVAGLESLQVELQSARIWGFKEKDGVRIPAGLYTGYAGLAWLFLELNRVTGEAKYLEKARLALGILLGRHKLLQGASMWDNSCDIVSGAAGMGLVWLRAAADLQDPGYLAMAREAGEFLVAQSIATPSGLKWKTNAAAREVYPNFAHGTAGVSYFLLRLAEATRDKRYLAAATRGALELQATADCDEKRNGCTWYHHEGNGEDLWYVGWCHGPAGTARLFYEFDKVNLGGQAKPWLERATNWLLFSGIPNPPKPINGYWNESICCGTAGVADFMLDLYTRTRNKSYLDLAAQMAAHLARSAETTPSGYRWIQAENRLAKNLKEAQTGYSQGAAGIGLFFLKLSRVQRGESAGWRLPDNPF